MLVSCHSDSLVLCLYYRLYVSPIKPPTPAQKKVRVTDWLVQDMNKDMPSLLSVRQHLSFQSQPLEMRKSTPITRDLPSNSTPEDSHWKESDTQSLKHRNQDGKAKLKAPHQNKKVKDKSQIRPPGNMVYGHHDRQEEEKHHFHNTDDDDELWEFQQNEEKMELDEFAEVEAMINEGHEEEASEELLHGGYLTDEAQALQTTDYNELNARVYQPLSSVSTKTTGIRPTMTVPRHTVDDVSNDQLLHLLTRKEASKPSATNSKHRRALQPPKPISKLPGTHNSQSLTDSRISKLHAPKTLRTSGSVGKSRLPSNPPRSLKIPSQTGVRQLTTETEHERVQVAVEYDQIEVDDDESWKEGCF